MLFGSPDIIRDNKKYILSYLHMLPVLLFAMRQKKTLVHIYWNINHKVHTVINQSDSGTSARHVCIIGFDTHSWMSYGWFVYIQKHLGSQEVFFYLHEYGGCEGYTQSENKSKPNYKNLSCTKALHTTARVIVIQGGCKRRKILLVEDPAE